MRSYQENDLVEIEEEATADNECPGEEYLLTRAAEQGFVTYDDVLTVFPQPEEKIEELEDILATLIEAGVEVRSPKEREEREGKVSQEPKQADVVADREAYFDTIAIVES